MRRCPDTRIGWSHFDLANKKKHRTSYALSTGVHVDIDKYFGDFSHIPELMEIEGGDISTVREHAKLLGFGPDECKSWDTFALIDYYSGKKELG